jgi:hypothetical protein
MATTSTVGKIRFNPRGTWVSNTAYKVDDIVEYNNNYYRCKANRTSTTLPDQDTSYWTKIGGGGLNYRGEWSSSTSYRIGDQVTRTVERVHDQHHNWLDKKSYVCIANNSNKDPNTQSAYWKLLSQGTMRDKFAYLKGINEGYVHPEEWDDVYKVTASPSDEFGPFKTPGSHTIGCVGTIQQR